MHDRSAEMAVDVAIGGMYQGHGDWARAQE